MPVSTAKDSKAGFEKIVAKEFSGGLVWTIQAVGIANTLKAGIVSLKVTAGYLTEMWTVIQAYTANEWLGLLGSSITLVNTTKFTKQVVASNVWIDFELARIVY